MTMKTLVLLVFTIVLSLLIVTSEGLSFSEEDEETDEKILASLKDISSEDTEPSLRVQLIPVPPEGDEVGRKSDQQGSTEAEFGRDDLVDLVEELEQDALEAEREQLIPQILGFLHGSSNASSEPELRTASSSTEPSEQPTTTSSSARKQILHRGSEATNSKNSNIAELSSFEPDLGHFENSTFVDEGDLLDEDEDEDIMEAPLPRDLSDLTEDIADDITAGVEESLRLFNEDPSNNGNQSETRQLMSMYLFQGQYVPEPRLNRFIDGALRNMGTEMRISSMDPLFFRVLPRGMVEERGQPNTFSNNNNGGVGVRRRRPLAARSLVKRQASGSFKDLFIRKVVGSSKTFNLKKRKQLLQKQRRQQILLAQRRKRQRLKKQRLQAQRKKVQQQKRRQKVQRQKLQLQKVQAKQRIRRRIRQDVGGGRVEGLSRVQRDGDAEMQLFGNYTLIRSHMKIGPVELTMQFRTRNGIKRTGATLPAIRAHTVTRVNHEGSEMVDFLLDRPHPETIKVRGNLFPLAQKIARNIFARLFLPNSFMTEKMREKTGLALLSRPIE